MSNQTETIEVAKEQKKLEDMNVLRCPTCNSVQLIEDSSTGEIICRKCGTVVEEQPQIQEPSAFTPEERKKTARTGGSIKYSKAGRGMRTTIGQGSMYQVSPAKRGKYYRMRKWQQRIDESRDRKMTYARGEIERLVAVLNLPDMVKEEVSRLYEKSLEKGVVKGRKIENLVAALIYIIARNQGAPRTMAEISRETGVSEKELGKNYRYIARELDLRIVPVNPQDFLPRFASELEMPGEVQATARMLVAEAREENILSGRSPDSIVAAALYVAAKLEDFDITQKKIAETVGVTEVTVRKGYRELTEGLGLEEEIE